jgi:hypothetical protein
MGGEVMLSEDRLLSIESDARTHMRGFDYHDIKILCDAIREARQVLRDHFAGLAMQALTSSLDVEEGGSYATSFLETVAKDAYDISDAMLAERERRK